MKAKAAFNFYLTVMALKAINSLFLFDMYSITELYKIIRLTLVKKKNLIVKSRIFRAGSNESKRTTKRMSDTGYDSRRHRADGRTRRDHEKKE